ncbi:hypothetical protein [Actinoplanes sp. NPDC049316]|uniref:hypothetical protein n=1 Tax=Actinoplanes sp. NPDC049316 TaxID=3154727 RepID=UPI003439A1E1
MPARSVRSGVALSRRVIIATVVAVVVRGLGWLFSLLIIGPVLGTVTFGLLNDGPLGTTGPPVAEGILALLSIAAAVAVAAGVRRDEDRWFPRARVLGWVLVTDTVLYLGSVIVALLMWGGWADLADLSWAVALLTVGNAPLIWLGASMIRAAEARAGGAC